MNKRTQQELKVKNLYFNCLAEMGIDKTDAPTLKVTHRFNRSYEVRSGEHDLYGRFDAYTNEVEIYVKEFTIAKMFNDETIVETLAHELTHYLQSRRAATVKDFMLEYKFESNVMGYKDNKFEVEARSEGERIAIALTGKEPSTRY